MHSIVGFETVQEVDNDVTCYIALHNLFKGGNAVDNDVTSYPHCKLRHKYTCFYLVSKQCHYTIRQTIKVFHVILRIFGLENPYEPLLNTV